jgi:hypothetical protein
MTQSIQTAVAARDEANQKLEDLRAQLERCSQAIEAGNQHAQRLDELRQKRAEAEAQSFLDGKPADLKSIDTEIAALDKQTEVDRRTASAADTAANLLKPQIDAAQELVAAAAQELKKAIAESMTSTFTEAEQDYQNAVELIKAALAKMNASASIRNMVGFNGPHSLVANIMSSLSGNGQGLIQSGLVVKRKDGSYQIDVGISRLLPEQTADAQREILADLASLGATI